jgi:drug/metabolite transporter (DMT)-like permease
MAALALALGASFAWGCSDFLAGLKSRQVSVLWVLLISQGTGLVVMTAVAGASGEALPGLEAVGWAAASGVAELIGFAALYRGLAIGAMSVVAPVSATAAIFPLLIGLTVGEAPTALQGAGIAVAIGGVVLASLERPGGDGGEQRRVAAGISLAVLAALGFGMFFIAIDAAADEGPLWAVAISRAAAFVLLVGALARMRRPRPPDRGSYAPLAAVGLLDIAANAMFALALTLGLAAVVSVVGSLYPVATVLLARVVLHEQTAGRQRAGVLAALAGVGIVSLGPGVA